MNSAAARELSAPTTGDKEPISPPARRELLSSRHQRWRTTDLQPVPNACRSRLEGTWYGACKMALEWVFAAILLVIAAATAWWLAFPAAAILLVIFTAALEFTFRAGNRRRP